MVTNLDYLSTGRRTKKRKPFSTQTKKRVWMKAGGHDSEKWRSSFVKSSKCMKPSCRTRLVWGSGGYDFDHKDNNSANNSIRNCFLVCKNCHGKATKVGTRTSVNPITGQKTHKRIKKKVGYKKTTRRKTKARPKKKT